MHIIDVTLQDLAYKKGYRGSFYVENLASWLREREIYPYVDVWKDMDHHTNFLPRITKHAGIKPLIDKGNKGLDILEDYPIYKDTTKPTYEEAFEVALRESLKLIK